jgi:hypothetical protein
MKDYTGQEDLARLVPQVSLALDEQIVLVRSSYRHTSVNEQL